MEHSYDISVIVAGRNDDYGTDWKGRFERNLLRSLEIYPEIELICVEWNPPPDRVRLSELPWPRPIRWITVPEADHRLFDNPAGRDFLEFHARNVGIRRATKPWVLLTNTDIDLTEVLDGDSLRELEPGTFYRAVRVDYEQRSGKTLQVLEEFGPFPEVFTNGSGDFILAERTALWDVRGFPETPTLYYHGDSYLVCGLYGSGRRQVVLSDPIYHEDHPRLKEKSIWSEWREDCYRLLYGESYRLNGANWGLNGRNLDEKTGKGERLWKREK